MHHVQTAIGYSKKRKKKVYDISQHTPFKPGRLHNQRWKAEIHLYFPTTENAFRKCVCQLGVHSSTLVNLMWQQNITQNATIVFRTQH
jgi:hypothetical protein